VNRHIAFAVFWIFCVVTWTWTLVDLIRGQHVSRVTIGCSMVVTIVAMVDNFLRTAGRALVAWLERNP
jgi:hypothetical protein